MENKSFETVKGRKSVCKELRLVESGMTIPLTLSLHIEQIPMIEHHLRLEEFLPVKISLNPQFMV